METSQCVPSWDVDDPPSHPSSNLSLHHYHPSDEPIHPPSVSADLRKDYEVAELTWENGQLALHGLVPPRIGKANPKNPPPSGVVYAAAAAASATAWNKHHHRSGTLEAVVNQATGAALPGGGPGIEEWFGGLRGGRSTTAVAAAVDALVPCQDDATNRVPNPVEAGRPNRPRMVGVCSSQGSAVGSLAGARVESTTLVTLGTCREDGDVALTATATTATNSASPETESTSLGKRKALALDDYVSVSHTSSHNKHDSLYDDEEKASKIEPQKASASTKKRRAAAIHNQSERKRRDKINQRMKTLQKLVPNSSKTDKASMLDEVIEYLKQLQAQIQMMSRMNNMMMPMAVMPGQIPVPMMAAHLAYMAQLRQPQQQLLPQMGVGVGVPGMMDLASIGRSMPPSLPMLHPSAFLALPTMAAGVWDGSTANRRVGNAVLADPYSTLLACQMAQQPMSLDECSRMSALFEQLYQQQQQPPPPPSNGKSS